MILGRFCKQVDALRAYRERGGKRGADATRIRRKPMIQLLGWGRTSQSTESSWHEVIMESGTMGKVLVTAKIENLADLFQVEKGGLSDADVRRMEIGDALVDTGATILSMPKRLIEQLGLTPGRKKQARATAGPITVQIYGTTRLTIQERDCVCDVAELPGDGPLVIDRITIALLDLVVDPPGKQLIGNPAHGGERMIEMY